MIRQLVKTVRNYPRGLWYLFFGQLVNVIGFSIVLPFLGLYLHGELGVTMTVVGTIFLVASLVRSGALMIGGELSDLFGRRKVMLCALGSRIITFTILGYLVAIHADVLYIGAAVVLSYALGAVYQPAANAFVADVVPEKRRVEGFSLLRIGANAGWIVGPAIGGILASVLSYASLFYATTLCFAVTFSLLLFLLPETHTRREGQKFSAKDLATVLRDTRFLAFCTMSVLMFIVMAQLVTTFAVFSNSYVGISKKQVGLLYSFNGIIVVTLQLPLAVVIRRWNRALAMAAATMFFVSGYFLVSFAGGMYSLMLCVTVITTGEMIMSPTSQTLVANLAPAANIGRYMGVFGLARSTGWALGPFIGGMAMDTAVFAADPQLLWAFIVSTGVVGAVGFVLLRKKLTPAKAAGRAGECTRRAEKNRTCSCAAD